MFGRQSRWLLVLGAAWLGLRDVDPEELRALARERLAPPKRPKDYFALEDLPHTATGKLQRLVLAERFTPSR